MKTNLPSLTILVGNIGSGKSTVLPLVAKALGAVEVQADELFQTTNPFKEVYLEDQVRWSLANELWLTKERVKIMRQAIAEHPHQPLVVDSGLLMSWVYTYAHFTSGDITRSEWELYQEIFEMITTGLIAQMQVIFLNFPVEILLKRIKQRGRDYELEFYDVAYLKKINKGLEALLKKLKNQKVKVLELNQSNVGDVVRNHKSKLELDTLIRSYFKKGVY